MYDDFDEGGKWEGYDRDVVEQWENCDLGCDDPNDLEEYYEDVAEGD